MTSIHAFIDHGFGEGTYLRMLVGSGVFDVQTLKDVVKGKKTANRRELAKRLAEQLESGDVEPVAVTLELARQPRGWLALRLGTHKETPKLQPVTNLLDGPGDDEWYGPLRDPEAAGRSWYVRPISVAHFLPTDGGGKPKEVELRWFLFAQVEQKFTAFHWDGFTHHPEPDAPRQFRYWEHVPDAIRELEKALKATWKTPNLDDLILHKLWKEYVNNPQYDWKHRHIRAEGSGVALSARSAAITEIDERGIKALTSKLAGAAAEAAGITDAATIRKMENAVLATVIQDWGPRSYEFSLDRKTFTNGGREGTPRRRFRGHTYFGGQEKGIDSLQHVRCFAEYGSSAGALAYLAKRLGSDA